MELRETSGNGRARSKRSVETAETHFIISLIKDKKKKNKEYLRSV